MEVRYRKSYHRASTLFLTFYIVNKFENILVEHPEIPQRTGKLNEVNKFDAAFFGVHYKQAQTMDPMSRILLEKAYEAVVDAGMLNESPRKR